MGLNVYVYKNVKITEEEEDFDFSAYVIDKNWMYKVKNLEYDKNYTGDIQNSSVSYPYSSHNRFRETLIKIIGRNDLLDKDGKIMWSPLEKELEMPFYELINFADNEGCLDFEISKKLYDEFLFWKEKAMLYFFNDDYSKEKYLKWIEVFENGKEINAVVVFR